MARKKDIERRTRSRSSRRPRKEDPSSDSDSAIADASSTASALSSGINGAPAGDEHHQPTATATNNKENESNEELEEIDDFEHKLELVLDQLQSSKSARSRVLHYESLAKALTTRFCFDYFDNRKVTMQDILEHSLKRSDDEPGSAASTLSLLLITMGSSDFSDDIFRHLFGQLDRMLLDHAVRPSIRAKCAVALSLGCFITEFGLEKIRLVLSQLLTVAFSPVKGHADSNYMNALFALKATCLDMFSFLICIESDAFVLDRLEESIQQLSVCLESPNLLLRVAAGECVALLLEKCQEVNDDYELPQADQICDILQLLATDSQKSRSKKELREQRSNFRQILRTVEGEDFGEETVKFGLQERVAIECWQAKRYYDTFCSVLGSGMNLHLAQNHLLRDIFHLGPVLLANGTTVTATRASKLEKQYINQFNRKAREIHRGKQRRRRAEFEV